MPAFIISRSDQTVAAADGDNMAPQLTCIWRWRRH